MNWVHWIDWLKIFLALGLFSEMPKFSAPPLTIFEMKYLLHDESWGTFIRVILQKSVLMDPSFHELSKRASEWTRSYIHAVGLRPTTLQKSKPRPERNGWEIGTSATVGISYVNNGGFYERLLFISFFVGPLGVQKNGIQLFIECLVSDYLKYSNHVCHIHFHFIHFQGHGIYRVGKYLPLWIFTTH